MGSGVYEGGANSGQFEVCNNETGKLLAADDLGRKPADGSWIPAAGVKPVAAHFKSTAAPSAKSACTDLNRPGDRGELHCHIDSAGLRSVPDPLIRPRFFVHYSLIFIITSCCMFHLLRNPFLSGTAHIWLQRLGTARLQPSQVCTGDRLATRCPCSHK